VITWSNFISQLFNGLALGALLALIASGLTIIYGTLGVLNLAHGAMFMLGGYAGYAAYQWSGSFVVAVIAGTLCLLVAGLLLERLIIRHFYGRPHEDQLLLTFGLSLINYGMDEITNPRLRAERELSNVVKKGGSGAVRATPVLKQSR